MAGTATENIIKMSIDNYTSTLSHMIKNHGDKEFINILVECVDFDMLYCANETYKLLYTVGCIRYLCRINNLPVPDKIMKYRNMEMPELTFPPGVEIYCRVMGNNSFKEENITKAIPEFWDHKIVETDVRDAC